MHATTNEASDTPRFRTAITYLAAGAATLIIGTSTRGRVMPSCRDPWSPVRTRVGV